MINATKILIIHTMISHCYDDHAVLPDTMVTAMMIMQSCLTLCQCYDDHAVLPDTVTAMMIMQSCLSHYDQSLQSCLISHD